ncbi:Obg family GTPase CgtA [Candidatus Absconditicoccus praedator]|uniref:Obg family GTPase CgtA n=1 Tax=Candidatus Absconditicoccus praedator TaxID=2735562 RepID=UPI001E63F7F0|nr:Obg family GTPase CgtA [Candidatus Absconditicoccus praedator]UFX82571.1 Obg family GTPase CgtA [Candidatus Absconditicoccus praedator]
MKFFDKADIQIYSGAGGDGVVSGRRESKVPYGGPNGGDGGRGGNVILKSTKDENTLLPYRYKKILKAENGKHGQGSSMHGKSADDLILEVPIGTLVKDSNTGKIVYSFNQEGESFVVLQGGRGGFGNTHFKSSTNQFPEFALYGEPRKKMDLSLELQLFGDVALIGKPSVGKSTIINSVSNAKAEVAEYPFTTIVPNLGMVDYKFNRFCMVDVPGLIEKAGEGKGLGFQFLRHILKSKIWTFVLDLSEEDMFEQFKLLLDEISSYIQKRYLGSVEFDEEIKDIRFSIDQHMNFYVKAYFQNQQPQILFIKKIVFFLNKKDLIPYDVLQNKLHSIQGGLVDFFEENYNIVIEKIDKFMFVGSGATKKGIDEFLDFCVTKFPFPFDSNYLEAYIFEKNIENKISSSIKNITNSHIDMLYEQGYIEDTNKNVWEIVDETFAYYVSVLPWGNTQAEDRFWRKLSTIGYDSWFENNGIKRFDVLKVISPYVEKEDVFISYEG